MFHFPLPELPLHYSSNLYHKGKFFCFLPYHYKSQAYFRRFLRSLIMHNQNVFTSNKTSQWGMVCIRMELQGKGCRASCNGDAFLLHSSTTLHDHVQDMHRYHTATMTSTGIIYTTGTYSPRITAPIVMVTNCLKNGEDISNFGSVYKRIHGHTGILNSLKIPCNCIQCASTSERHWIYFLATRPHHHIEMDYRGTRN